MKHPQVCVGARAELGEHFCQLHLQAMGEIEGGLWSWRVYVDGNIHGRGPGSTGKDPLPWYGSLPVGLHRLVLRKRNGASLAESNVLEFEVSDETVLIVQVHQVGAHIALSIPTSAGGA